MDTGRRVRGWARRAAVSLALAAIVLLATMADSATGATSRDQNTAQSASADGLSAQIGAVPHRPGLAHRLVPGHVVDVVRPTAAHIESAPRVVRLVAVEASPLETADRGGSDARAPPAQGAG